MTKLARSLGGPVHHRVHGKADGRKLHLYGRTKHAGDAVMEAGESLPHGGELRFHPLRGEWNVYASHRQGRTFKPSAAQDPLAPSRPGGPATEIPFTDFEIAIFDNKFAAFHPDADGAAPISGIETRPANGACEVVVYDPAGDGSLHTIGQDRREVLLAALIHRYEALFASGCDYVLPFENRGDAVGVTLHHPHGQIYGFDHVPPVQRRALAAFAAGYSLEREIAAVMPQYGIGEDDGIAAFVPRFARFPYEVWLAPSARHAALADHGDAQLVALARWLGEITRRYDEVFEGPAATMMAFHAAPRADDAHWHFTVQFYPLLRAPARVKYLASVEQHTGLFTVDVMPEEAAEALRDV